MSVFGVHQSEFTASVSTQWSARMAFPPRDYSHYHIESGSNTQAAFSHSTNTADTSRIRGQIGTRLRSQSTIYTQLLYHPLFSPSKIVFFHCLVAMKIVFD